MKVNSESRSIMTGRQQARTIAIVPQLVHGRVAACGTVNFCVTCCSVGKEDKF
jgi:hypothetical protein